MVYLKRRMVQVPYNRGVFIQRGGGIFSSVSDFAVRYARPWFQRAIKTASSSLSKASKSKAAKDIMNEAASAVKSGIRDAGKQILQGENIAETLKNTAGTAKSKIADSLKRRALESIDEPTNKRVKKQTSKKTKKRPRKKIASTKYRSLI